MTRTFETEIHPPNIPQTVLCFSVCKATFAEDLVPTSFCTNSSYLKKNKQCLLSCKRNQTNIWHELLVQNVLFIMSFTRECNYDAIRHNVQKHTMQFNAVYTHLSALYIILNLQMRVAKATMQGLVGSSGVRVWRSSLPFPSEPSWVTPTPPAALTQTPLTEVLISTDTGRGVKV